MNDDMENDLENSQPAADSGRSALRLTTLARAIDPRLPSHRKALLISIASGALALAVNLDTKGALGYAFNAGVGSFLGWAVARELDPDRPNSAALSGIFAGATIAFFGEALLLPVTLALVTSRVLHRSTGLPPTLFDVLALVGVAYAGGTSTAGWAAGLALAFAVARDHRLPTPAPRFQLIGAFLVAASATAGAVVTGLPTSWQLPTLGAIMILGVGLFAGLSLRIYEPATRADHTNTLLEVGRLQSARMGALGTGLLAFAMAGGAGIVALSPVWAAVTGVALWDRMGRDRVSYISS